jgi:hypothetical protein
MELTNRTYSEFQNWLYKNHDKNLISENCGYSYGMFERDLDQLMYVLPNNAVCGVFLDFFDSVGIYLNAVSFEKGKYFKAIVDGYMQKKKFNNRVEALVYSIEKANDVLNSRFAS